MKWNSRIRNTAAAGVITLPLLLSGCGLFGGSSAQIDPPPTDMETRMLEGLDAVEQTSFSQEETLSTVYLVNEHGKLAPVALHLPEGEASLKLNRMLELLVKDGKYAGLLPAGFNGILPAGSEVKAVTVKKDEKLAIVEFNKAFVGYEAADERKILEALTWTLTGTPDVEKVQLWVEGEKLNEMPVNGTPLDRPLNRNFGINLELKAESGLSQLSPVIVYFSAATPDGVQYFVPVTRFVPAGGDQVKSALGELLKGPQQGDGLERVVTDNTKLDSVEVSKDGVVTVALTDDMFEAGEKLPAQMLQSLVLTVTENKDDSKVRIWLNGQKEVVGMDNQTYSEPVMRPETINEIPL
ncbi:MAG: GerMN domain-containing protein [Paenibacillaceae bacterium]|uniref:GerMN domain-containing protein n=1 Tax=Paenibacillus mellifer TaxID=2937794 RepID=A0A9X1Y1I4_9BACL|nr:GerMN domain-containing protein [Paenibacillus mellifer]MBW4840881.1 GerMN domain-containing protein [Paenibacillaceae bacterium]MCK8488833.1 GerMN domain-containing protein [Paenibacillus mellifer]